MVNQYCHLFNFQRKTMKQTEMHIQKFIHHGSVSIMGYYDQDMVKSHELTPNAPEPKYRWTGDEYDMYDMKAQILARFIILKPCLEGHSNLMDCILTTRQDWKVNSINIAKKLITQMLYAVKYLHDKNFVHRDLKPQNFIFEKKFTENNFNSPANTRLILGALDFRWVMSVDSNIYGNSRGADDDYNNEQSLFERLINSVVLTKDANYMSPELAFHLWFYIWSGNDHDFLHQDENVYVDDIDLTSDQVMKYEARCQEFTDMVTDLSEKQYLHECKVKSLNIDTSDEFRNARKQLFERYQCLTPQMLKASDIWSIGIIAYFMITGTKIFGRYQKQKYVVESIVASTGRLDFPQIDRRYGNKLDDRMITPQFKVKFEVTYTGG